MWMYSYLFIPPMTRWRRFFSGGKWSIFNFSLHQSDPHLTSPVISVQTSRFLQSSHHHIELRREGNWKVIIIICVESGCVLITLYYYLSKGYQEELNPPKPYNSFIYFYNLNLELLWEIQLKSMFVSACCELWPFLNGNSSELYTLSLPFN